MKWVIMTQMLFGNRREFL